MMVASWELWTVESRKEVEGGLFCGVVGVKKESKSGRKTVNIMCQAGWDRRKLLRVRVCRTDHWGGGGSREGGEMRWVWAGGGKMRKE